MTKEFTFDDLKKILIEGLGTPEEEIPDDPSTTFHDLGFDSIDFAEIQRIVETEYGIFVPDADAQQIMTFGQAIEYTNRRLQGKE